MTNINEDMSRTEALRILHCPDTVGGIYSEKYGQALYVAMQALEQEPCKNMLSREAVLGLAKQMYLDVANSAIDAHTISDCVSLTASKCREYIDEHVRDLPPVASAHKIGPCIYADLPNELDEGMTIGDIIMAIFPNLREIKMVLENEDGDDFEVKYNLMSGEVSKEWNAPYKGEK